jgi:REP element-mobilizing transposase RayT
MAEKPFTIDAAILPEHVHFLWTLPPDDCNYSYRVGRMKVLFTHALRGVSRGECDRYLGCQCGDNIFTPQVASLINPTFR